MGIGITLKRFTSKFFYVMGKALSGELSSTGTGLVFHSIQVTYSVQVRLTAKLRQNACA